MPHYLTVTRNGRELDWPLWVKVPAAVLLLALASLVLGAPVWLPILLLTGAL